MESKPKKDDSDSEASMEEMKFDEQPEVKKDEAPKSHKGKLMSDSRKQRNAKMNIDFDNAEFGEKE